MNRLVLVGLVITSACSSTPDPKETYTGWHCEEQNRQGSVQCVQGKMNNGRLIDTASEDKSAEPAQTEAGVKARAPVWERPLEIIWVGKNREKSWREQLPGFTVEESTQLDTPEPTRRADISAPQPEAGFGDELDKSLGEIGGTPPAEAVNNKTPTGTAPKDTSEQTAKLSAVENSSNTLLSGDFNRGAGFTVQLGAFASDQAAQRFLRDNDLFHLDIAKQEHESAGQYWHVLTFGYFTDKTSAQKAWSAAAENSTEIDVWIRPVKQ